MSTPAIVQFRPVAPAAAAGAFALHIGVGAVILAIAIWKGRSATLECAERRCNLVHRYGLFVTSEPLPVAAMHTAEIRERAVKHGKLYGVVLNTAGGAIEIATPRARDAAIATRDEMNAFIRGSTHTLNLTIEEADRLFAVYGAGIALVALALACRFAGSGELRVDLDNNSIVHVRRRWPLPPVRRTYRVDALERAHVVSAKGKSGTNYRVMLAVRDEGDVLFAGSGGDGDRQEMMAKQLNVLLRTLRERRRP